MCPTWLASSIESTSNTTSFSWSRRVALVILYEAFVFCDVVTHPIAEIFPRGLCWRPLPFRRLAQSERYTAHFVETSIGGRRLRCLLSFCDVVSVQYVSQGHSRHFEGGIFIKNRKFQKSRFRGFAISRLSRLSHFPSFPEFFPALEPTIWRTGKNPGKYPECRVSDAV